MTVHRNGDNGRMSYPLVIEKLSDEAILENRIRMDEETFDFWMDDGGDTLDGYESFGFVHISQVPKREDDEYCFMIDGEPYLHFTRYRDEYYASSSDLEAPAQTISTEQYLLIRRREAEFCRNL